MNFSVETWKDIPKFEGRYQASNLGRIKSLSRKCLGKSGSYRVCRERILKLSKHPNGYVYIKLRQTSTSKQKSYSAHKLIVNSFLGPAPNGLEINHKDGNSSNNNILNFEFISHQQNTAHGFRTLGTKGYSIDTKCTVKYIARIFIDYVNYYIGRFNTPEEAQMAYRDVYFEWYGIEPNLKRIKNVRH
jgi:hypothetical protein